jgi:hypothetical protein
MLSGVYFAIAELALVAVYLVKYCSGRQIVTPFWVLTGAMAFAELVFATPALINNLKQRRGLLPKP